MFFGLSDELFIFTRQDDDHIRISANGKAVRLGLDCTGHEAFLAFHGLFDREAALSAFLCCVAQAAVDFESELDLPDGEIITAELARIARCGFNGVYPARFSTPDSSGIAVVCSRPEVDVTESSMLSIGTVVETKDKNGFGDFELSLQTLLQNVFPPASTG